MHYTDAQNLTKIDAMFGRRFDGANFVPLSKIEVIQ
jgi:hypothetical protein